MSTTPASAQPKRPQFHLAGLATVKHLNVRKEGPEDDKDLAVDVKLEFSKVDMRICRYFDDALVQFFWRSSAESLSMVARNAFLQPVAYCNNIEGAAVTINKLKFLGCDVKRFTLLPRDGGTVDVTCSISLQPSADEVAALARLVQDGADVTVLGPADLFDEPASPERQAQIEGWRARDQQVRDDVKRMDAESAQGKTQHTFPRYRDAMTGNTWTGRGKQPGWVREAIKRGAKLEDFDTTAPAKLSSTPAWPLPKTSKVAA